jgi:hypothetical protein
MELWKRNGSMYPASARSLSQHYGTEIHYTRSRCTTPTNTTPYHTKNGSCQTDGKLQTLVRDCTPPCASAQGHTNTMFLLTMTNHVVVEPRPFTASSSGVVYCSSYYWLRKAGTRCASKGAERASSGKADLFGSAPTQLGLGDWSYMSELYLVSWPLPALPTFRN